MIYEFSRTELLLGAPAMDRLKNSRILIFGVGGVGSHCIEALARSGIGHFILVDNDQITLTNINRQSIAYHSTIGKYKTQVMKERILDINPNARVKTHELFVLPHNIESVFAEPVDYVIDAIDIVTAKLAIVQLASDRTIPILSSMGTGNKLDPTRFEIADIHETSVCPLCKVMRRELKKRNIRHLTVLYSKEEPHRLKEETNEQSNKRSIPGSISFVPPVAGIIIAGEVIKALAK